MAKVEFIETEEPVTYVDVEYSSEESCLTIRVGTRGGKEKSIRLESPTHVCGIAHPDPRRPSYVERQVASKSVPLLGDPLRLLLESARDRVVLWLGPDNIGSYVAAKRVEF